MPETRHAPVRWLLACLLTLLPLLAMATPRIGVVTMAPGEVFWERFGHDAIVVMDARGDAISYNFGYFDPNEPDFIHRFVRGQMRYRLVALPLAHDLIQYREAGRGVSVQWLNIRAEQAEKLAAALAENARPENAYYHYDYFRDNCATRVRDALNFALDGALAPQLAASTQGNSYRSEALRLAAPEPWMWTGFQLGLGPNADHALSRWDEAFIPMRLADSLRLAKNSQGEPLVLVEEQWLPHYLAPEPAYTPWYLGRFALAGLLVGLALILLGPRYPRLAAGFAFGFWLLAGLLGILMLYLWLGSAHWAAWRNLNLLLMHPLLWLLLPGAWVILRGRTPSRCFVWLLRIAAFIALLSLLDTVFGVDQQRNGNWIALLLPIHLTLAALWARPGAAFPSSLAERT
ncbi:hypothetical protein CO608_05035 [Lysobacteraceae bacterium NML08-0793]|nr:hypothetical protein CO608_05035 [Xanthomonadaceae bacterium NML08-0793]